MKEKERERERVCMTKTNYNLITFEKSLNFAPLSHNLTSDETGIIRARASSSAQ